MELKMNENLYVKEVAGGYQICIDMPDSSRNYMHCEPIKHLEDVSAYMKDLNGLQIEDVRIITDSSYYRLYLSIPVSDKDVELHFHSRKLNLNDVYFEKEMIESGT